MSAEKNILILVFVSILLIMPVSAMTYDLYPNDAQKRLKVSRRIRLSLEISSFSMEEHIKGMS